MNKENWKKVSVKYFPKANSLHIQTKSTDFYPQYLKYYLQYLRIPENAKLIFTDKTFNGGVIEMIKNYNKEN